MIKVIWQSKNSIIADSINSGKLLPGNNGGNAYDFSAAMALKKKFDVHADEKAVMKEKENVFQYWARRKFVSTPADITIQEPYPVLFGKVNSGSKQVAMIHHIDDDFNNRSLKHKWFLKRLKKNLPKVDLVIAVSGYWENYLRSIGCEKTKVIYNSFNVEDYSVRANLVDQFKTKYGFISSRPLVYIGNAQREKGVYEVYEALKNSSCQLVMTGYRNLAADLPVKYLNLSREEYLCLLQAADVTITMSHLLEGWNRIAHESLLSRTPVIGSGKGGMKELLEGAGQKMVTDFSLLPGVVEEVIQNRIDLAEGGFLFASKFSKSYFENEWITTISDLLNSRN